MLLSINENEYDLPEDCYLGSVKEDDLEKKMRKLLWYKDKGAYLE